MSQEDVLLRRLAKCHAEACKEIERSVKAGRSLGDAVLDAIEALPPSKTRDLRRWLEDWEAWEEWEKKSGQGWAVKKKGRRIYLFGPLRAGDPPSDRAIAAGAGVQRIHARTNLEYISWLPNGDPVPSAYKRGSRVYWPHFEYLVSPLR